MPNRLTSVGRITWGSPVELQENRASGEMEWVVGLVLPEEDAQPVFAAIEEVLAEKRKADPMFPTSNDKLTLPFKPAMKKNEAGELEPLDGFVTFNFKRKRLIKKRGEAERANNTPPSIYDSSGHIVQVSRVPIGTEGKVVYDAFVYSLPGNKGVSLGLRGFQIVRLAETQDSLPPVEGGWKAEQRLDDLLAAADA